MAKIGKEAFDFIVFLSPFLKPFIGTLLVFKGVLIAIAIVTKIWAVAQGILNAVMSVNPISLIIIAIAALVAVIVLLVQNWDIVVSAFKSGIEFIANWFSGLLENPFFVALGFIFLPFITIPALILKHWEPVKAFFSGILDTISNIPGVDAALNLLTDTGTGSAAKPVSPQERLSRSIETSENNSTLTIQDRTGTAELSPQQRGGPQISLSTSGGL